MTNIRTLSSTDIQNLFARTAVGAERYFDDFFSTKAAPNYPPYDIEALSEDNYRITIAVAGFTKDELSVRIDNGHLNVKGTRFHEEPGKDDEEVPATKYPVAIHKGIAKRDFDRTFKLMEYVVVSDVALKDGLLVINLKRELPEALKPRTIDIG
ncbi:Small heat shock protein IbpA [compost metagenome]